MDLAMVGLGVMGRNLLLNMADHGFPVVGFDRDATKVDALLREARGRHIKGVRTVDELIGALQPPRGIMLLVPAGAPVDAVIRELLPRLSPGDVLIDGGNSHFTDTDLAPKAISDKGVHFLGVGVSDGESGARHGPSMMPGGPRDAYELVRPVFEAVAAQVGKDPCVTYLGPGSAGHYVKMVHNGIEYGLMELIAESYDLMHRGLGLTDDELADQFDDWNRRELNSFLVEITGQIFRRVDDKTGSRLVDVILDQARQKGTGMWTSQDAMNLQVTVPTIDAAVQMRDISGYKAEREAAAKILEGPARMPAERDVFLPQLREALYAAMILTYAQGMVQLRKASDAYHYDLPLGGIAKIWRGGCIIRAALLEKIHAAFEANPALPNLCVDPQFAQELLRRQKELRAVVTAAVAAGIPAPGFGSALAYFDAYRSAWLPANLIQAQRDFGTHTYERIDAKGVFHTIWTEE